MSKGVGKHERELQTKIHKLTAQIARVEASAKKVLRQEDESLQGTGAGRLLEAERMNQDLHEAKQKAERRLRHEKQRNFELKAMMEHSKKRTDRLLFEKHALIRQVGQLEGRKIYTAPSSPARERQNLRAATPKLRTLDKEEKFSSEDKPFAGTQSMDEFSQEDYACSDSCSTLLNKTEELESKILKAKVEVEDLQTWFRQRDSASLSPPAKNSKQGLTKIKGASIKLQRCAESISHLQQLQRAFVEETIYLKNHANEISSRTAEFDRNLVQMKVQQREINILNKTVQQTRIENARLDEAIEEIQCRSWAASCQYLEEITCLKRTIRELKTVLHQSERRESEARKELMARQRQQGFPSIEASYFDKNKEALSRENMKLRIQLQACLEKLSLYDKKDDTDKTLAWSRASEERETSMRGLDILTARFKDAEELCSADKNGLQTMNAMLLQENATLKELKEHLQRQQAHSRAQKNEHPDPLPCHRSQNQDYKTETALYEKEK